MKNIFAIIGSASYQSSNLKLVEQLAALTNDDFNITIFEGLRELPHFNPEQSVNDTPEAVLNFREHVAKADGILFSTPEYIFSIPSGLKNCIEWCVSTTVFSGKPTGIITASAHGQKGHEELMMILRTVECNFIPETALLIQGVRGKLNDNGTVKDPDTAKELIFFVTNFKELVKGSIRK